MTDSAKPIGRLKWVVGVGASAGGLEALTQFVAELPKDFPAPIIIAQHLAPHSRSMMVELLQKHTDLRVVAAESGAEIESGFVYVIPPNHDADIGNGKIELQVADERTRPKPSVDDLFESLARSFGKRAVGIILSGTGSDGSKGIQAIKAAGGITLAQDDDSAKYDGMPRSAVDTGNVDSILPPGVIAKTLVAAINEHEIRGSMRKIDRRGLETIFAYIKERLGQDFRSYKSATMYRRIVKRMAFVGAASVEDYFELIKSKPGEVSVLAQELLVSVTSFFRDPEIYDDVRELLAKRIELKNPGEELRIWCAGCATGEEAYTIAILALDMVEKSRRNIHVKVFATDLDHDAILEARAGLYPVADVDDVPSSLRDRYFQRFDNERYEVSKRLRDVVVFARQDLIQNPPFVKLDMISCRNVMIYFEASLQAKIFEIFHYALLPSGGLLLGKSESPLAAPGLFEAVGKKSKTFEKINVASRSVPAGRMRSMPLDPTTQSRRKPEPGPSIAELAYRRLANNHGISGVVIDAEGNVLQILGDVSAHIGFFNSMADLRLANLLPKSAGLDVPILIRKVLKDGGVQRSRLHKLQKGPKGATFNLVASSLAAEDDEISSKRLIVISFETKRAKGSEATKFEAGEIPARVAELEEELHVTREHLQTVIEELGISNEELQSLNEELSSTNEELQATNEELETTNEELQSSNEELTTVNEEVSAKSLELRLANVSLENIQNSIGSALLVLDSEMRVVRYNAESQSIFRIEASDIGRNITQVSANCEIPDFKLRVADAIRKGVSSEAICESGRKVYQMRILPSYDENAKIIGAIIIFIDNTEQIRTQERLKTSEERVRAIIDGSSSHVVLKDTLGRYLVANDAFCKYFGLTSEEVVGRTDREILPEATANMYRDADLEVMMRRAPVRREERVESEGGTKHFYANRFPLYGGDDKHPTAIGTISVDISAQIEAQQALQKSEGRYRAVVEDQVVFVCRFLPDGKITFANTFFSNFFGGTPEMNVGRSIFDVFDKQEGESFKDLMDTVTARLPMQTIEVQVPRLGSEPRWVRWMVRGVFDSAGKAIEYQAVGFDVSEYRTQTEQLLQKEAIFGGIFDNTSDVITIYRVAGGRLLLESLNKSAEQSAGISYTQLIGKPLEDFVLPEDRNKVLSHYEKVMESGKSEVFDESLHLPAGARFFSTTLVPIRGRNGKVERIAALSRDVSGYKQIERDLRRAKDGAEIANRAKSDFLASMSHELRTPLNVVLGLCQILEHGDIEGEDLEHVHSIHRSGRVLLNLIEDILDISKIEAGKVKLQPAPFAVRALVDEVVEFFKLQAKEKGIDIVARVPDVADQVIVGDVSRIRQIFVNLVANAVKFTDQGRIEIKVDSLGFVANGSMKFRFTVTDSGIGIKDEDHQKIFQKFSQVESGHSRRYGGTGLGLVISKYLAELMNGEMGFESAWGRGSTFWFTIEVPLSAQAGEIRLAKSPKEKKLQTSSSGYRILAIDDNRESRKVIELFLKRLGHVATVAASGAEALAELKRTGAFDMVLMDVQMPEMDGYETTQRIRRFTNGNEKIPIIALTANAMSGDADRCLEAGMDDYLSKPLDLAELSAKLRKWGAQQATEIAQRGH